MCASQIARSPITNRWGEVPLRRVPHEEVIVYRSEYHDTCLRGGLERPAA